MMGKLLESGELELTDEECDALKLPVNSVIPESSVSEIKQKLQDIADEDVRTLFRQVGKGEEEAYPGYWEDLERLGLDESSLGSENPGNLYGPDGRAYAPWMVGKVAEKVSAKRVDSKSKREREAEFAGRGAELSGVGGLQSKLLGDEVRLEFSVVDEEESKGYIISRRPGGSGDEAFQVIADYLTPGAMLAAGNLNGEYSYVDGSVTPGSWVYKVQEEDAEGNKTYLSQTIIEVPSNSDKVKTLVSAAVLGGILTALTVAGISLDPQNGIN